MKKLIVVLLASSMAIASFAQQDGPRQGFPGHGNGHNKGEMADNMKAARIAFITSYVGLTPEEAQVFWPLFNKIDEQQNVLVQNERKAYFALSKAMKSGEGDVAALLDAYLAAKKANVNLHVQNVEAYKKILPMEKVAKLFTSEEQFRREQISRLRGQHHDMGPQDRMDRGGDSEKRREGSPRREGGFLEN